MTERKPETVVHNHGFRATGVMKVTTGWLRLNLWTVNRPALTQAPGRL
jgi:hypothetical protein